MTTNTPAPRPSAEEVVRRIDADILQLHDWIAEETRDTSRITFASGVLGRFRTLAVSLVEENAALTRAVEERDEALRAAARKFQEIAFLRPGGPTRNKLVMAIERIAIDARDAIPTDFRRAASLSDMGGGDG